MEQLGLSTASVVGNQKESILCALADISMCDADFSGENGEGYLWPKAKEAGFESNQEYVLDCLKKSELDNKNLIRVFFEEWLDNDPYYSDYQFNIIENETGEIVAIALAIMTS